MATPAVIGEYTPGSRCNSRKPMRLPPRWEMRPDSPICLQSNSLFLIKHVRSLDFLDITLDSPQEHPHTSRRTLMTLQESEIARCITNELVITPDSPAFSPEQFPVPHHTRQVTRLPLGNYRISLRHRSQLYRNIDFSTGTRGKLHALPTVSR